MSNVQPINFMMIALCLVFCSAWLAVSNVNVPAITAVKSTLSAGNEQGQIVGAITAIQVCTAFTGATLAAVTGAANRHAQNDVADEANVLLGN